MNKIHNEFSDVFSDIGCSEGTFTLEVRDGSQLYQVLLRRVAHFLQECLKEELQRLQRQQIIVQLGMDETSEWCNSFVLVPKANGKVRLCLDPASLNKALIRPVHKGLILNYILPRTAGMKYLKLIDASSGYNLNLDDKSSYLTTFSCSFGRYQYIRLPFGAAQVRDMFKKKMDNFSSMLNVFVIANDILIAGFDEWGKDHDATLERVLCVCMQKT